MKKIFSLLTLLIVSCSAFGQTKFPFGGTGPKDTAYAARSLKVDSGVVFTSYHSSDTDKVIGIGPNGLLILRTKRNADSAVYGTQYWGKTNLIQNQYSAKQTASSWQDSMRASIARVDSGIKTAILIGQDNLLVNSNGFSAFNGGTLTYNSGPHTLTVTSTGIDKGVNIGSSLLVGRKYQLVIDVTAGTGGAMTFSKNSLTTLTALHNGINTITFIPTSASNAPTITCSKAGNFTINSYKLYATPLDSNNDMALRGDVQANIPYYNISGNGVAVGPYTFANVGSTPGLALGFKSDASAVGSIALGPLAYANGNGNNIAGGNSSYSIGTGSVAWGDHDSAAVDRATVGGGYAVAKFSTLYDPTASTGGENSVYGYQSFALSWRACVYGPYAIAASTSSSVFGYGAFAGGTHYSIFGRGAFAPYLPSVLEGALSLFGADNTHDFYLGNSWGHKFSLPPTGISISNYTPINTEQRFHGQDAYDQQAVVTDTNVAGGHIGLCGGRGTGTGAGGEIRFETAPADGSKTGNQKNSFVLAGKFDATTTTSNSTRFLILDLATSTMRRVKIGDADSGGSGKRILYVDN